MATGYSETTYFYDEYGRACPVHEVSDLNSFDLDVYDYEIDVSLHGEKKTVHLDWEDEVDSGLLMKYGVGWYKNTDGEKKRILSVSSNTMEAYGVSAKTKTTVWGLENDEQVVTSLSVMGGREYDVSIVDRVGYCNTSVVCGNRIYRVSDIRW